MMMGDHRRRREGGGETISTVNDTARECEDVLKRANANVVSDGHARGVRLLARRGASARATEARDARRQARAKAGEDEAAALRDRVEALKMRIDERYRASRRESADLWTKGDSLFEPTGGENAARAKARETERALARLVTRANLEARAEERQERRNRPMNDSAVISDGDYDEIFSEKSTEGSFHGARGARHRRQSSFEEERIKFDSALPSVVDDECDRDGRRNPSPGRTREWLDAKGTPLSPKRSERSASLTPESGASLLKSPRRNGSFKMLNADIAKAIAAEEAVRPRARRAMHTNVSNSPEADSPQSASERSFSRTSSTLSIASLCASERPASAFSPVAQRSSGISGANNIRTGNSMDANDHAGTNFDSSIQHGSPAA